MEVKGRGQVVKGFKEVILFSLERGGGRDFGKERHGMALLSPTVLFLEDWFE